MGGRTVTRAGVAAALAASALTAASCSGPARRPEAPPVSAPATAPAEATRTAAPVTVRVTAVGDSLTEASGWSGVTPGQQWLALVLERLGEHPEQEGPSRSGEYETIRSEHYALVNAGIAGDTTWQMRARFEGALRAQRVDVCIVFGGSNDIEQGLPVSETKDNLTWMVRRCAEEGIVPVMATVPPRTDMPADACARTRELNTWIRRYAREQGITCADFFAALEWPRGSCSLPLTGRPDYTEDGTHPNAAGNAAMAAAVDLTPFRGAEGPR